MLNETSNLQELKGNFERDIFDNAYKNNFGEFGEFV